MKVKLSSQNEDYNRQRQCDPYLKLPMASVSSYINDLETNLLTKTINSKSVIELRLALIDLPHPERLFLWDQER